MRSSRSATAWAHRRAAARAGAPPHPLAPRGRGARSGQAQTARRDRRAARRARAPPSARTCWPTSSPTRMVLEGEADLAGLPGLRARCRQGRSRRAQHARQACHHAAAFQRRAVPAILGAARSPRKGVPRLDRPRRHRRQDRQQARSIAETIALRAERAKLLGYPTFAHYRLDDAMAKTPDAVRNLLQTVWKPARVSALKDRDEMQEHHPRGGRQLQARRLGLALLLGEAAQAPLRLRGVGGEAVLPRSTASSRRRSSVRASCSGSPSRRPTRRSGIRTCAPGR